MPLSDFSQDGLRSLMFRSTTGFVKPPNIWVSLHTADPTDAGSTATEVTSTGAYVRVASSPADNNWTSGTATNGQTANTSELIYPTPTAAWGTVTHLGLWTSSSAGDLICYGPLASAKIISSADPAPKFAVGALSITFV